METPELSPEVFPAEGFPDWFWGPVPFSVELAPEALTGPEQAANKDAINKKTIKPLTFSTNVLRFIFIIYVNILSTEHSAKDTFSFLPFSSNPVRSLGLLQLPFVT